MDIREVLSGGDLRSVGHVDEVVAYVGNDPERFSELMTGLTDARSVVRMRSADAMEKVTRRLRTSPRHGRDFYAETA